MTSISARRRAAAFRLAAAVAPVVLLSAQCGCEWQWPSLVFTAEGQRPDIPIGSVFPGDREAAGLRMVGGISPAGSRALRELLGPARAEELYRWRVLDARTAIYSYPNGIGLEDGASGGALRSVAAGNVVGEAPAGATGDGMLSNISPSGGSAGNEAAGGEARKGGAEAVRAEEDASARRRGGPAAIRLAVVEFGSPEAAYGALSHIRPKGLPDEAYVTLGMAGYRDGNLVVFAKAWFVVVAAAPSRDASLRPLAVELARAAARRIPHVGAPIEIEALPAENRKPGTETYERGEFFGIYGTEGWARAEYSIEGCEAEAFVVKRDTKDGAKWILERLRAMCGREAPCRPIPVGDEGFMGSLKGKPLAAARTHTGVYCVTGAIPDDKLVAAMRAPDRAFRALAPPKPKPPPRKKDEEKEEGIGARSRLPFSLGM